jgi:hypothetical protein
MALSTSCAMSTIRSRTPSCGNCASSDCSALVARPQFRELALT